MIGTCSACHNFRTLIWQTNSGERRKLCLPCAKAFNAAENATPARDRATVAQLAEDAPGSECAAVKRREIVGNVAEEMRKHG